MDLRTTSCNLRTCCGDAPLYYAAVHAYSPNTPQTSNPEQTHDPKPRINPRTQTLNKPWIPNSEYILDSKPYADPSLLHPDPLKCEHTNLDPEIWTCTLHPATHGHVPAMRRCTTLLNPPTCNPRYTLNSKVMNKPHRP